MSIQSDKSEDIDIMMLTEYSESLLPIKQNVIEM